jgi:hypothetical protein
MPEPINCNEEEARRFLGLTQNAFSVWRQKGWIVPVMKGLYNFEQLKEATAAALAEATKHRGNVPPFPENVISIEEGRKSGSQGQGQLRTPKEFLRQD